LNVDRRGLLAGSIAWSLTAFDRVPIARPKIGLEFASARAFSYERLRQRAKSLATRPYVEPVPPSPDIVKALDFAVSQKIAFRPEYELWPTGPGEFPVRFFHLSKYADVPVKIHVLKDGVSREIVYSSRYFTFGGTDVEKKLPANLGFSGFRVMNGHGIETDWVAFQGASYFRTSGAEDQYGISARGIAVNTALSTREEFPRFTEFWLAPTAGGIEIYALLESPSLTGAYKFEARRADGVVMNVHADLFARADIERLGIAPLTSMYWYSESNYGKRTDWRPAIHDSDGLALWTGVGERIWRPLADPPSVQTNSFLDTDPKGFGLLQRDRNFDDYQDDGAFYNRRPSLWVEPLGKWGDGAVQLVEIPTDDEVQDNIVAYWQPKGAVKNGDALAFDYRLYWQAVEPSPGVLGRVVATRVGRGGIPGLSHPKGLHKFVIDFEGGPLASMQTRFDVAPIVDLSHGKSQNGYVIKVVGTSRWRAFFDVLSTDANPIDIRCYLRLAGKALTETWLYQFFPTA
jgi:periplasmic glucans biosynthesis protein